MGKCKTTGEAKQVQLQLFMPSGKEVSVSFDGGQVCSDGGLLLLRKADDRLGLSELVAQCLPDMRRPDLVTHKMEDMCRQRFYGIAAGYEDCNDATRTRHDGMHLLAVGREPRRQQALASQSTLQRFEDTATPESNKLLQKMLVHLYFKTQKRRPNVIKLSLDTTCDPTHGYQQMSFYNGYYETNCYAPLFIFTDDGFPLKALLRPGNENAINDAIRMMKEAVQDLRSYWKGVRIELKADSAFAAPELFEYCEANNVTFFIASKGHEGLAYHVQEPIKVCKAEFDEFGVQSPEVLKYAALPKQKARALRQHEERIRFSSKEEGRMQEHFEDDLHVVKFGEFQYESKEWGRRRRFIFKIDYTKKGAVVRFVVTNKVCGRPRDIYQKIYSKRAQCENWIKDLKTYLKCDRTSCQEFDNNQFRLLEHTFAYILIWEVRRRANLREMTVETFRLQLLKIGVLLQDTGRKIQLSLASDFAWQQQFIKAWQAC